jgi:drug/metabolite transporter (DMT)-like permease
VRPRPLGPPDARLHGSRFTGHAHDASGFALCRQVIGALLMATSALAKHGRALLRPRREHAATLATLGLLNYANSICFIWGFQLTSSFVTSVAQLSIPVLTYAYTSARGLEPASGRKTVGVCLIVLGCLLTAAGGSRSPHRDRGLQHTSGFMLGLGLAALAVQCAAFTALLVVQKPVLDHYPVSLVVAWGYSAGALCSVCSSLVDGSIRTLAVHLSSAASIGTILCARAPPRARRLPREDARRS